MDINSLIALTIAIAAIFLFVKFVVSPLIKAILGIIAFIAAFYILQRFFNLDLGSIFGPVFKWIISPFNNYLNLIKK